MKVVQKVLSLAPRSRGYHIITAEVLQGIPEVGDISQGIAHLLLLHTSAGLTLNENADPDVRTDFRTMVDAMVPDGDSRYIHTIEGPDDMAAHIKTTLTGASLAVPVRHGTFLLGRWQGIYLCEFRNHGGPRQLAVTILGT